jgi:hypothetical protein
VDLRAEIESASAAIGPIAVLAIEPVPGAAELWLSDRLTGKLVIRRIQTRRGSAATAAADLALRAVELLRGSLLEITVELPEAPEPPPPPPPDVARFVAQTAPGHRAFFSERLGLGAGATLLGLFAPWGPAYAPVIRLSYGRRRLASRLSLVGPATAGEVRAFDGGALLGTAQIRQEMALLEGLVTFRPEARLQPFLSLGAGLHHVRVTGQGAARVFPDRSGAAFGLALDGGAGLAVRLGPRAALLLELHLLAVLPQRRVLIVDQEAARVGRPGGVVVAGFTTSF